MEIREFIEENKKYNSFKKELKELLTKYNVSIKESECYNGMDEYVGCELYFVLDGECLYRETITELITKL